jgi:two-component system response regulator YesN
MIRVVVVEDEAIIRKGLVMLTPWANFNAEVIAEAGDGIEGEALITKLNPELVITDIRMPGASGLEMMRRLKGRCDSVFIIVTSYEDFSYAKQGIELGVLGYILKPLDQVEFAITLRKAVEAIKSKVEARFALDFPHNPSIQVEPTFSNFLAQTRQEMRDSRLAAAIAVIKERYMSDLTARDACDTLGISESSFNKMFKSQTGYTFLEYLTNYRMKIALDYLSNDTARIYEIADLVGYTDYRYFSEVFKKYFGCAPSDFRKRKHALEIKEADDDSISN